MTLASHDVSATTMYSNAVGQPLSSSGGSPAAHGGPHVIA